MTSRLKVLAIAAVAGLCLVACGSDDGTRDPNSPAPAGDECKGGAKTVSAGLTSSAVQSVEIVGQCTTVTIKTNLVDGSDAEAAKAICTEASKVAYTGGVNSIRVLGTSGMELSRGTKGLPCLA